RQIATLQRLIELKDDQLAALQSRSAESAAAPAADRIDQSGDSAEDGAGDSPAADAPEDINYADGEAGRTADTEVAAAPRQSAPPPKPGLLERLTSNWLYLGGLLAALVLALVAVLVARRRRAEADEALSEAVFRPADRSE